MTQAQTSLFRQLTLAFVAVSVIPILLATYIGVDGFLTQTNQEATRTAAAAREIAAAADQQRAASEQVVQAMQHVSLAASETVAAARQVGEGAVGEISGRSEDLNSSLDGFRV